jgi:lipopolysaccharide transport system ATP-binding protein
MSTVIKVENLGKRYILNHQNQKQQYSTFRDSMSNIFKKSYSQASTEEFWALRDLNFEIKQGDRVGIIGRNGAGKSTLLKILSRITEPTTGKVKLKGRIASLLEVGTGFHPELTGRENIFLNGAILGMSRDEIRKKFDEIVSFAEVEKFLDTPVKRYSSGMYVRLAFSVAAHLEPEILIIDEVLAVGDIQFQKKCLGRMEQVGKDGRTVLFVSHNMSVIGSLCNKAIQLSEGKLDYQGITSEVIKRYFVGSESGGSKVSFENRFVGSTECRLLQIALKGEKNFSDTFDINDSFNVETKFEILKEANAKYVVNLHFMGASGEYIFVANQRDVHRREKGTYSATCIIPARLLNCGVYSIGVAITKYTDVGLDVMFFEKSAVTVNLIEDTNITVDRYNYGNEVPGLIRPLLNWTEEKVI